MSSQNSLQFYLDFKHRNYLGEGYLYSSMLCITDGNTQIQSEGVKINGSYNRDYYTYIGNYEESTMYLEKTASTWTLDKETLGMAADEKILAASTSLYPYHNEDEWMKTSLDDNNNVVVSVDDNNSGDTRYAVLYVWGAKSRTEIAYRQYCEAGKLDADKTEVSFPYNGDYRDDLRANITISHDKDAYISYVNNDDWISVYYTERNEKYTILTIAVTGQEEFTDATMREGIIKVSDNRGNSVDIKVTQDLLTLDEVTIKTDKKEVNFGFAGGTESITLTHPENAEIRVESARDCRPEVVKVDDVTSTLMITMEQNREESAKEITLKLSVRLNNFSSNQLPVTEIKVTQAAITPEEATIKADKTEIHFTAAGGTETVTLTHAKNAGIRVRGERDFYCRINAVNEVTSTLTIEAYPGDNRAKENTLEISLEGFPFEVPITKIKVTQDAGE